MRFVLVGLALLSAGCLEARDAAAGGSGAFGVALLGPTCPVERDPPDPACADRPFEGELKVVAAEGDRVVATFPTDSEGRFNVTLAPGAFAIRNAGDPNRLPTCASAASFVVSEGSWTPVDVFCDTGIR